MVVVVGGTVEVDAAVDEVEAEPVVTVVAGIDAVVIAELLDAGSVAAGSLTTERLERAERAEEGALASK